MKINEFEKRVIYYILQNEAIKFPELLDQLTALKVTGRSYTGVGSYTKFELDDSFKIDELNQHFGNSISVYTSEGFGPIDFVLFVKEGKISLLEAFCYEGTFPEKIADYTIKEHAIK